MVLASVVSPHVAISCPSLRRSRMYASSAWSPSRRIDSWCPTDGSAAPCSWLSPVMAESETGPSLSRWRQTDGTVCSSTSPGLTPSGTDASNSMLPCTKVRLSSSTDTVGDSRTGVLQSSTSTPESARWGCQFAGLGGEASERRWTLDG